MKKVILSVLAILLVSLMSIAGVASPGAKDPVSYKVAYRVGYYDATHNLPSTPGSLYSKANWLSIARKAGFSLYDNEKKMYYFFVSKVSESDWAIGYRHGYNDGENMKPALYTDIADTPLMDQETSFDKLNDELTPEVAMPSVGKTVSTKASYWMEVNRKSYMIGYEAGIKDKAKGMITPFAYLNTRVPKMIAGIDYDKRELSAIDRTQFNVGYRHATLGLTPRYDRAEGGYIGSLVSPRMATVGQTEVYDSYEAEQAAKERRWKRRVVYKGTYTPKAAEPAEEEAMMEEDAVADDSMVEDDAMMAE